MQERVPEVEEVGAQVGRRDVDIALGAVADVPVYMFLVSWTTQ